MIKINNTDQHFINIMDKNFKHMINIILNKILHNYTRHRFGI